MEEHWKAGHEDPVRSLNHKDVLRFHSCAEGIMTHDLRGRRLENPPLPSLEPRRYADTLRRLAAVRRLMLSGRRRGG
jgi:hypothetical protein